MRSSLFLSFASVVFAVLILGLSFYLIMPQKTQETKTGKTEISPTPSKNQNDTYLLNLILSKKNLSCSFNTVLINGADYHGTFYMGGGNLRGYFSGTENNRNILTDVLMTDGEIYAWPDKSANGIKAKVSFDKLSSLSAQKTERSIDYKCEPWILDDSKFKLPKNVTFTDMTNAASFLPSL